MNKTPTDGERWTMERAADFLEWYASFIREHVMSVDIEMHPYLPELEYVAGQVRDWFKPAASPMNKTKHITQEGGGMNENGTGVPGTEAPSLTWCEHCGEGVTDFCRGKLRLCPKGLRVLHRNAGVKTCDGGPADGS